MSNQKTNDMFPEEAEAVAELLADEDETEM